MQNKNISTRVISYNNDPDIISGFLGVLPNPDPVLGRMGIKYEVYSRIMTDAHVMCELRAIRAGLLSFETTIQAGGDKRIDRKAADLCRDIFHNIRQLDDVLWQISEAVLLGHRLHEVVWEKDGSVLYAESLNDVPARRIRFNQNGDILLRTRKAPNGEDLSANRWKWLLTRHMSSYENPYGVAVFSACFWPIVFKHGGMKFFTKFVEKYSIPWPIGKYPEGTTEEQQKELFSKLKDMVEDSLAVLPESMNVSIIELSNKGEVHTNFINLMNRELSKALTNQTLATEIQGTGSYAAAETHSSRADTSHQCDRNMISSTINLLFRWIVEINIPTASPPKHNFYQKETAPLEWIKALNEARKFMRISPQFASERTQIQIASQSEESLPGFEGEVTSVPQFSSSDRGLTISNEKSNIPIGSILNKIPKAGDVITSKLEKIRKIVDESNSLEEVQKNLARLYTEDMEQMATVFSNAYLLSYLFGVAAAKEEEGNE
jgi:phage gp29-like protein